MLKENETMKGVIICTKIIFGWT